jgi:cyclopropane fatty-acyl-phospholipid synthase-like methyltransferase
MKSLGLAPEHTFLEIGCGCFRAGRFFLDYLNDGNYFCLDADAEMIEIGMEKELNANQRSKVLYVITDNFDLRPHWSFDFLIAQSVFTHLPHEKFKQCIDQVNKVTHEGSIFVVTVFEFDIKNKSAIGDYKYTIKNIQDICGDTWIIIPAKFEHARKQSWFVLIRK